MSAVHAAALDARRPLCPLEALDEQGPIPACRGKPA